MPAVHFAALEADESQIPQFFEANFPGVRDHISDASLIRSFGENPHQSLISIKCKPYHFGSAGVIVGDAAHAMAPFYGQGMNVGMEDVRILFSLLDKHALATEEVICDEKNDDSRMDQSSTAAAKSRYGALAEYSASRWRDAHAINDLAMQNYLEMRTSQSIRYRLRKALEEFMHVRFPSLGWQSKYSRVVFSNEPYAECMRRSSRQGRLLFIFAAIATCPFIAVGLHFTHNRRNLPTELWRAGRAAWQWHGLWKRVWNPVMSLLLHE